MTDTMRYSGPTGAITRAILRRGSGMARGWLSVQMGPPTLGSGQVISATARYSLLTLPLFVPCDSRDPIAVGPSVAHLWFCPYA